MEDHKLSISELLSKYRVARNRKNFHLYIDSTAKNAGRTEKTNLMFKNQDISLFYAAYSSLMDPIKMVALASVVILGVTFLIYGTEWREFIDFFITILLIIITVSLEIYEESKINEYYRQKEIVYSSKVLIANQIVEIENEFLVISDHLFLNKGDIVPADSVLIKSRDLKIDRCTLSEGTDIIKKTYKKHSEEFKDSENVLLASDRIVSGECEALVVLVGNQTAISQIYRKNIRLKSLHSLLYKEIHYLFLGSLFISLLISLILICFGLITGIWIDKALILTFSVCLTVIPNRVPSTVKFMLFKAVFKLEKRNIIIRDVGVIEKLGLMTILCSEETIFIQAHNIFCSDIYNGKTVFDLELAFEDRNERLMQFLCSISQITNLVSSNKSYKTHHHTSLEALSEVLLRYFVGLNGIPQKIKDLNTKDFDGTIVDEIKYKTLYITGSVESILNICNSIKLDDEIFYLLPEKKHEILKTCHNMKCNSSLALAFKSFSNEELNFKIHEFTFICIYFFKEMPRFDTPLITNILKSSKIKFSILANISSESTALQSRSIVGIEYCKTENLTNSVITFQQLKDSNYDFKSKFLNYGNFIIYNCNRTNKKQIIDDLKKLDQIVGYMGNEIKDCQAMIESNIGICFENSSPICKEACNIILETDRIDDLFYCLEEGRLYYINLQKAIRFISSHILPQLIPLVLYAFVGSPIALSSVLLVILNYLVELIPGIYFSNEEPEINLLVGRPNKVKDIGDLLPDRAEDKKSSENSSDGRITDEEVNNERIADDQVNNERIADDQVSTESTNNIIDTADNKSTPGTADENKSTSSTTDDNKSAPRTADENTELDGSKQPDKLTNLKVFYNKASESIKKIKNHGLIYHLKTVYFSALEIGIITSIGCMLAFFATFQVNDVPYSKMFFSANTYFKKKAPPLMLTDGTEIDSEIQIDILRQAQSTYFIGLVICQFATLIVCRRAKNYFFTNFFKNFQIIIYTLFGVAISFVILYLPFIDGLLLIQTPVHSALLFPVASALLILLIDTYRKYKIKSQIIEN